jgi:probable O-glycosylation ligase (exosortase A-associated)
MISFGAKTLITGGGYKFNLGLLRGNSLLAEGATLATFSLVTVPLILFLMKHGRIFPKTWWVAVGYIGLIVLALATSIGTHERTALAGLFVLGATVWWYTRYKIRMGFVCIAAAAIIAFTAPASWYQRMSTITAENQDTSILVRFRVWQWTLDYAKQHPLGGGFEMYHINTIEIPSDESGRPATVQYGRAFHSSYFEMLGEQGWPGLVLFLSIWAATFATLYQCSRIARRNPHYLWAGDLSRALRCALLIQVVCSAFIGIGYQTSIWYVIALSVCLREYLRRMEAPRTAAARLGFEPPSVSMEPQLRLR